MTVDSSVREKARLPAPFSIEAHRTSTLPRGFRYALPAGGTLIALASLLSPLAARQSPPNSVEYDRRTEGAPARWVASSTPTLVIGEVEGPEEFLLTNPIAAVGLTDGTIVIRDSNQGYFNLRYFDDSGAQIASASRFGQGPFEFQYPLGVHGLPGDSIFVLGADGRFGVFGPRGEPVREGRYDRSDALPAIPLSSRLADATHIVLAKSSGQGVPPTGVHRDEITLLLWSPAGGGLDTLTTVLSTPTCFQQLAEARGVAGYPYPYAPETSYAAAAGRVWVGQGDLPEVRGYDSSGELAVVIRFTDEPPRVGWSDRRRFRLHLLEGLSGDTERRYSRYARSAEFPSSFPYFGHIEADRLGRLWVERYQVPWSEEDQLWDVFGQDGEWEATVTIPNAMVPGCARDARRTPCDRIREIGETYLLLDMGDPVGVRRIARFDLAATR